MSRRRIIRTIIILSVTGVFDYYYTGMLSFALPQLQREFHLSEGQLGPLLGLLRLGFIPAVFITVLADFIGRKPFIILCNVALIGFTAAAALVPGLSWFITCQLLGFMFISAETSVAVVMIVEEAKNMARGFAVSTLSGLSSIGTACAAIVYAVNSYYHLPFRYMYLYGIPPLLVVVLLRTRLKETSSFDHVRNASARQSLKKKMIGWTSLLQASAGRLFFVSIIVLFYDACAAPTYIMASKFLQEHRHFMPYQVTALIIGSGFFATVGTIAICYLSDKAGRKKILLASMGVTIASVAGFYHTQGSLLYLTWFLFIVASASSASLLTTIGTELFPTATRASATGIRGMFSATGGAIGLVLQGKLQEKSGGMATSLSLLTIFILLGIILTMWKIPETAKTDLS